MERQRVQSSSIYALGYDEATHTVEVEFNPTKAGDRAVWAYEPIEPETYQAVISAPSVGRAFAEYIKNAPVSRKLGVIDAGEQFHEFEEARA